MGVNVVTAATPLSDDARAKMKLLGPAYDPKQKPTPYNMGPNTDAAPFDSAPGIGFDASPAAAAILPPAGKITGSGPALAVDPAENNAFRALNRAWKAGLDVQFKAASSGSPARYLITGMAESAQNDLVKSLALSAERMAASGAPMKKPRIGLVQANNGMDEGWTRWVLEQYGFDFIRIPAADVQAGSLRDKIDVLIVTDDSSGVMGGGRGGGRGGGAGGGGGRGGGAGAVGAGAATAAASTAAAGAGQAGAAGAPPAAQPAVDPGVKAIDDFVKAGGTLVCFDRATLSAIDALHLPVKNVTTGLPNTEFFVGGSVMQVTTDPSQRVMSGMPEQAAVFLENGPAFDTLDGFKGAVLAKYQTSGSPLMSGFLQGEKYLLGKAAALDVELGSGHVVLIGFRPQWRGQPFGTFRIIFNSAIYAR
jgi:hypothetical protein